MGPNSLFYRSLLSANNLQNFVGYDFLNRRVATELQVECSLGDETFSICITEYASSYITGPMFEDDASTDRTSYELPTSIPQTAIACIGHCFGQKDDESPELWNEILTFLRNGTLPHHCDNPRNLKTFTKHAKQFIFHDNRLWKMSSAGRIPCLVITDLAHQQNLIAEAHNEAGHRGHDATYKHLTDCFYWPNMFNEVAFFVVSCIICQLWSASRPKVPFSSMWNSTILRHFDLDTNHMPEEDRDDQGAYVELQPPYNGNPIHNKNLVWVPILEHLDRHTDPSVARHFRTCPSIQSLLRANIGLCNYP